MVSSFMEGWPIEEEHKWNPNLLYQLEAYNQISKKDNWCHQWLEEVEVLLCLSLLEVEKGGSTGASSEKSPTFWGGQVHSTWNLDMILITLQQVSKFLLQWTMRYIVKPQMITLQTLKDWLPHERLHMTIDGNVDNTNPTDYIITKRTALNIISITVLKRN